MREGISRMKHCKINRFRTPDIVTSYEIHCQFIASRLRGYTSFCRYSNLHSYCNSRSARRVCHCCTRCSRSS